MTSAYRDYYRVLGLERTAGEGEIKAAYRRLARKHHPDLHTGSQKEAEEEKFKEINEAYEVLSDPEKRAKYDKLGIKGRMGRVGKHPIWEILGIIVISLQRFWWKYWRSKGQPTWPGY
ncbi:hypothetical protein N752_20235 [Desulforamulus aquiferis]|nr:DnaJ domain-containing protein [Desulforamulus aquiferis]RYD03168.1 hypothetical protein N752_20235 [Desulforamulus aquiferis]